MTGFQAYAIGSGFIVLTGLVTGVLYRLELRKLKKRQEAFERRRAEMFRRAVTRSDYPQVYRRRHYDSDEKAPAVN